MASKREQVILGVLGLFVTALPYADVQRNRAKPDRIAPGGMVNVADGDPGEPEVDLSPLTYNYEHRIPVEIAVYESASLSRMEVLDTMLGAVGQAVCADRTLGGLVDFLEVEAPVTDDLEATGALEARWANLFVVASYATQDPLN